MKSTSPEGKQHYRRHAYADCRHTFPLAYTSPGQSQHVQHQIVEMGTRSHID